MKPSGGILWIDDNPDREKRAIQLEEATGLKVQFISVKGMDLEQELPTIRAKAQPGLVIIDHVLNGTTSQHWAQFGSTLAGFFRETWPGCPIFGITAAGNLGAIDFERYAYDELIDYDTFSAYVQYVPNVIDGFGKCSKVRDINEWIRLLKPPKGEDERIEGCIPCDAKTQVDKNGFPNRIYRWFRGHFYAMPGFLYDREWVATFVGVKKERIDKYLSYLNAAHYSGLFNHPSDPRWWKAQLYQVLYSKYSGDDASYRSSQEIAANVLNIGRQDQSRCYVCHEKWPEVLAYVDATDTASRQQMHLKCTMPHPHFAYEPMFEEIRVMGEGKSG